MRPSEVMSAGMMPALDLPGEAMPGQFGPTIRVALPLAMAYAQNSAESCTGMPSVMTMASGMRASIASITASLVRSAGTTITGTSVPFSSTVWPALRGLVPPTTLVPAASMRAPCLRPSEPVMPWIRTRLWLVRKIAISCSVRGRQLGGAPGGIVHGRYLLDHADPGFVEDPAALGRVVAVQPHHDRVTDLLAALTKQADRGHDA